MDVSKNNVTRAPTLTGVHGPEGVTRSFSSPIIIVCALRDLRWGLLGDHSTAFAPPPILNSRFPFEVVEIGGVVNYLLVWGVRRDFRLVSSFV